MDTVIEARDLRKTYGETVALDAVSLSVGRGEVYALIGPNGAGKTTLVRALTGTTEPNEGTATVLGEPPAGADRDRLGVLPQSFSPPERLTPRELLAYYAGLYGTARDPDAVLADVGLTDAADVWYENLSGGQRRRVCVGSALVNDPDVLFLDEPTTGIDPAGRRTVWALIESLVEGGTTVVLTTHDMAEAERLADRVGLLADGSLVAQGTPETLVDEHGGASRLTVRPAAAPADLLASDRLDAIDHPIEIRDDTLVFDGVDPAAIGSIVESLDAAAVEYGGLAWSKPSLEDVYLTLAGERESSSEAVRSLETDGSRALRTAKGGQTQRAAEEDRMQRSTEGSQTQRATERNQTQRATEGGRR